MITKILGSCSSCDYPIVASYSGQEISCPMCGTLNEAITDGVTIPSWLLFLGIGLTVGILAGPAIMASTETGSRWLEKQVRERVK